MGLLAAIGMTTGLFVAFLTFANPVLLRAATVGVISASVVAMVVGYFALRWRSRRWRAMASLSE